MVRPLHPHNHTSTPSPSEPQDAIQADGEREAQARGGEEPRHREAANLPSHHKQVTIEFLYRAGKTAKEIIEFTGINKTTVWALMMQRLGRRRYRSLKELRSALRRAWKSISTDKVKRIVGQLPKRLGACIAAKGGDFEHLLK